MDNLTKKKNELCPLCLSDGVVQMDKLQTQDIVKLYADLVDIKHLFNGLQYIYRYKCEKCGFIFYDPRITGDEAFYEKLQSYSHYYIDNKPEYDFVKTFISEGIRILEIGSGSGNFAERIDEAVSYTGLEYNSLAVSKAQQKGINVIKKSVNTFVKETKLKFDIVCSFQVLEHVDDVAGMIEDSLKLLGNGGLLIIAVPNNDSYIKNATNGTLNLPPHHVNHFGEKSLENLADVYNLKQIKLFFEPLSHLHVENYVLTVIAHFIRRITLIKKKDIDLSFRYRLISYLAIVLSPFLRFYVKRSSNRIMGQTIVAVYRKK